MHAVPALWLGGKTCLITPPGFLHCIEIISFLVQSVYVIHAEYWSAAVLDGKSGRIIFFPLNTSFHYPN
jgi:hypothetical protein